MDEILSQAHAIFRFARELEEVINSFFLVLTLEKSFRKRIGTKATKTNKLDDWRDILPIKGRYFREKHYVASLKQLVKESQGVPKALERMAESPTLKAIHAYTIKATKDLTPSSKYGGVPSDFMMRRLAITNSYDRPSVCVEVVRLAQSCPLLQTPTRNFVSRLSLPLRAKTQERLRRFQDKIDAIPEIDGKLIEKLLSGVRAECSQVVAISFLDVAPLKARFFLPPSHQRMLEALKLANSPLIYDALQYEAGIVSRSTVANGLKTLEQLGLAKKLPGGGTVYTGGAVPDTEDTAGDKDI